MDDDVRETGTTDTRPEHGRFRHARIVLAVSMMVMGGCGIVYEYTLGVLGNNLMGSTHEQIFVIIGLMLFAMGLGSVLQQRVRRDLVDRFLAFELLLGLVGGLSPLLIYTAFVHTASYPVVLYGSALVIGSFIGLEIPLLIRVNKRYSSSLRANLSEILSMDYVGALAGALLFAFVLVPRVSVGKIGLALGIVNTLIAGFGLVYFWPLVRRRALVASGAVLTLGVLIVGYTRADAYVASLEQRCFADPIVYSETTPYQHLVVTRSREGVTDFYINGHLQFSSRDEAIYHEMLTHVPMTLARSRERVLILGGGDGLALREVLRFSDVREVTLVDLDPAVIELFATETDLVALNGGAFADARVHTGVGAGVTPGERVAVERPTHLAQQLLDDTTYTLADVHVFTLDADVFLREVTGTYDVAILDFPDPRSVELAKLYSRDFYRRLAAHLAPGAFVAVQSTSPFHARAAFLCIGETLRAAGFAALPYQASVPSFGPWGFHLAWTGGRSVETVRARLAVLDRLPAETRYLTPELVRGAFAFGRGALAPGRTIRPNSKMLPVLAGYYREGWR